MRPLLWLLWTGLASTALAEEWSRFRGPNGSGVREGARLPAALGEESRRWKAAIGFSRSSPVLGGACVFLTSADEGRYTTTCLDRETGAVRWRRSIEPERVASIYPRNDPTSPTPVSDGYGVYVFFPDVGLVSYSAEGRERWRLPLGPFNQFLGMSGSPILAGSTLVQLCDQQTGSFVLFVEAESGRVLHRVSREHGVDNMTTPVLYERPGQEPVVVIFSSLRVDAYSMEGELRWWLDRLGYGVVSSPVVSRDTLLVNAASGSTPHLPPADKLMAAYDADSNGRLAPSEVTSHPVLGVRFGAWDPDKDGEITVREYGTIRDALSSDDYGLVAFDVRSAQEGRRTERSFRWRHQKSLSAVTTPLVYRGVVYVVRDGGIVTSLDPATGQAFKTGRVDGAAGAYFASPVAADGKVLLVNEDCDVAMLSARPDWETLRVDRLGGSCIATPALDDHRIYIRTDEHLYAFGESR